MDEFFKSQYPSRTASDTLSAGKAVAIDNRAFKPREPTNIYARRAIERTGSALYAASGFRDHYAIAQDISTAML